MCKTNENKKIYIIKTTKNSGLLSALCSLFWHNGNLEMVTPRTKLLGRERAEQKKCSLGLLECLLLLFLSLASFPKKMLYFFFPCVFVSSVSDESRTCFCKFKMNIIFGEYQRLKSCWDFSYFFVGQYTQSHSKCYLIICSQATETSVKSVTAPIRESP